LICSAAQLIGFTCAETGGNHGELNDLFLKDGHAEGAFQHATYSVVGVGCRFQTLPAAQVGMDHVALNGAWANDGNLDHEVVEIVGVQAWQHGHLGTGFHLEYAHAVAPLQHVISLWIFGGNGRDGQVETAKVLQKMQRFADGGEHAEAQDVHFQEPEGLEVVFVPLDDGAVFHRCVFDGDQLSQGTAGDDKTADVLGEVAGKAENDLDQDEELLHYSAVRIDTHRFAALIQCLALVPPGQ
jgi:hypothetical protein